MSWKKREGKLRRTRVASFDLDGTLTDISFVDSVWLEGIPRLYANKNGLALEDAKSFVRGEYGKVGRERLEWYDVSFWIRKFGLDVSPQQLLGSFRHEIRVFPEVTEVLTELKHLGFRLIIVTNARREFADLEIEKTNIWHYFERVFSITSDFGLIKKTPDIYEKVCNLLEVVPEEMLHVGDDECFDFEVPKKLGIKAFYLDRTGNHSGHFVVHSLKELSQRLAAGI